MSTPPPASLEGSATLAINRIKSLVHYWMSIWDLNSGDAAPLVDLLSPDGFEIVTSTRPNPIRTAAEVCAWVADAAKKVAVDNHYVETIDVTRVDEHRHRVRIHVVCPGILAAGAPFLAVSDHDWEVVDFGGLFPKIARIEVRLTLA